VITSINIPSYTEKSEKIKNLAEVGWWNGIWKPVDVGTFNKEELYG